MFVRKKEYLKLLKKVEELEDSRDEIRKTMDIKYDYLSESHNRLSGRVERSLNNIYDIHESMASQTNSVNNKVENIIFKNMYPNGYLDISTYYKIFTFVDSKFNSYKVYVGSEDCKNITSVNIDEEACNILVTFNNNKTYIVDKNKKKKDDCVVAVLDTDSSKMKLQKISEVLTYEQ